MVIDDVGYDRGWCSVDLLGSSRQTNRQRAPNSNDGSVIFACLTELGETFKVSSRRLWNCQTIESTRHGASSCLPFIAVDMRGCDSVWTDDWCLLNALPWATQLLYYYSCSFFLARVAEQHILGSLLLSTGNGGCMQQSLCQCSAWWCRCKACSCGGTVHTDPIMLMGESAASRLRTHNLGFACEGVKSLEFNNLFSILEAFIFPLHNSVL